jgi:FkbM family methyltransferase
MKKIRQYIKNKAPIKIFVLFYNVASILRKNTPSCHLSKRMNQFIINDGKITKNASTRTRALTYYDGFESRAQYIAKTYFIDKISFSDGDVVIDCGANMGDLLLWFELRGVKIDYHGFEPNPVDFKCLRENCPSSAIYNSGLWNTEGSLDFYVSTEVASSSFIEPPNYTEVIRVPSKRLDSYFLEGRVKLLKLEAEGAEPEVLEGAVKLLPRIEYIAADIGPERGPTELSTREDVVKILATHNFEIIYENYGHRKTILFANSRIQ